MEYYKANLFTAGINGLQDLSKNQLFYTFTIYAFHSHPNDMRKITSGLILLLFFLFPSLLSQENAYLWCELSPEWQAKSLAYWKDVQGYGKKIPEEMTTEINQISSSLASSFGLKITEKLFHSDVFSQVIRPDNPTAIALQPTDLFVDLQCKIREVNKDYPYFRTGLLSIEPVIDYTLVIYNANGDIIQNTVLSDPVDYKKMKDKLRGLTDIYARDLKIYSLSHEESFAGSMMDSLSARIIQSAHALANGSMISDPARFHQVVSLLFEKRKNEFPDHYAGIKIQTAVPVAMVTKTEPSPSKANMENSGAENAVYGNAQLSMELAELLRNVKYYALIIGVNEYQDPKINDLAEPVSDATKLKDVLITNYTFDPANVIFLTNPTRNQIIQSFDYLSSVVTPDDNLLIFYAGHGLWDDQLKKGFWFPSDASHENRTNWFSNSDLRDYVGGIRSQHTLLISDACFSGGIFKTREVFTGVTQATFELYKLPSRKAMTSGAMTAVPDKSVFLEYLIKRLAENREAFFSSEQLFASFKIAVINNSATNQVPQFGEIRETGDEGGDFLFIRK
jgi:hypothetical protein